MPLLAFTPRLENKEKAGMDQWKGCPHHSFLGWYLGPPLDDAFSSSRPHRFSLLFSISLLFLLVRVLSSCGHFGFTPLVCSASRSSQYNPSSLPPFHATISQLIASAIEHDLPTPV